MRESHPQMLPTARQSPHTMPQCGGVHRLSRPSPRLEDATTSLQTSLDQSQEGSLTSLLTFWPLRRPLFQSFELVYDSAAGWTAFRTVCSSRACRGTTCFSSFSIWSSGGTWSRLPGSSATLSPSSSTDLAEPDHHRPITLASSAFKIFERLAHVAPHISDRLDECQGGFRWGADACVRGLWDTLRLREDMHTFCAFVDISKVFDTSWVVATLVGHWRHVAHSGQFPLWHTLTRPSLRGRISAVVRQLYCSGTCSHHFFSTCLVNSLAAAIRRASLGVRLVQHSDLCFTRQLHADDIVILADSEADLQAALDAITLWGHQWRFSFGIGPEKSAAMVFGPTRSRPPCSLSQRPLVGSRPIIPLLRC